jgi:(p)ppGpp synthase/HD superfamily hydrolase
MAGIDEAIALAARAHAGAKDLDGKPYILHPLAVGLAGQNEEQMICGFLHDVVEDTSYTFEDLLEMGFSASVVSTLRLLTHAKDEPYMHYIERILSSGNATALAVKMNDLRHNLSRGRAGGHMRQVEKHSRALAFIEARLSENAAEQAG